MEPDWEFTSTGAVRHLCTGFLMRVSYRTEQVGRRESARVPKSFGRTFLFTCLLGPSRSRFLLIPNLHESGLEIIRQRSSLFVRLFNELSFEFRRYSEVERFLFFHRDPTELRRMLHNSSSMVKHPPWFI
jgi:hypothetical protein